MSEDYKWESKYIQDITKKYGQYGPYRQEIIGKIARNEKGRIGKVSDLFTGRGGRTEEEYKTDPNDTLGTVYAGTCLEDNSKWESYDPQIIANSLQEYINATSEKLKSLLNPSYYPEIANYVVDAFDKYNSIDNLEYSFQMNHGIMKSDNINTTLKFDPEDDHIITKISNELNRNDIELTEEHYEIVQKFLLGLKDYFNNNCIDQIRPKIRKYILKDANEIIFPLKKVSVENIEINDSSKECPITVKKQIPCIKSGKNTVPKQGYEKTNISVELFQIHEETGKDFNTIIAEKQAMGDPKYQYVTGVVVGKRMKYIFHLDMFVDYSADKDVAEKYQKALEK